MTAAVLPPASRWQNVPASIVFDSDDIRVMFKPGGSDFLLLTFGHAMSFADGTAYFADSVVERHGLNCLGFMPKSANWFPARSMDDCLPHISYTLKSFARKVLYGCSMGAFAAIKHSRRLGASDVIAYCPQWSIDPAECQEPSMFGHYFQPFMAGMGITPRDMAGWIHIFFDPGFRPEAYHFETIRRMSDKVRGWHVHGAEHAIGEVLAGSQFFMDVLAACLAGDGALIYAAINAARRQSTLRNTLLLKRAATRHPLLALNALRCLAARKALHDLDINAFRVALAHTLIDRDAFDLAEEAMALLSPGRSAVHRAPLRCARDESRPALPYLRTAHDTCVLYSAFCLSLFHGAPPPSEEEAAWVRRVVVHETQTGPILAVHGEDGVLACEMMADGTTNLTPMEWRDDARCLHVRPGGEPYVQAVCRGFFMCAEADGRISVDREAAGAWEAFRLD
jgi:hypothetical protein